MSTDHQDFSGNVETFSGVRLRESANTAALTDQFTRTMNQAMTDIMPKWPDAMNAPVMRQGVQAPLPGTPALEFNVVINGQTYGPYNFDALSQMAARGQITAGSLVWRQGMAAWQAAGTVPDLAPVFAGAGTPVLPAPLPPIPGGTP